MTLDILDEQVRSLIELIYLGNWLASSARNPKERITEYDNLLKEVISKTEKSIKKKINVENLHDDVENIIKQFETDIFPSLFAKAYADYLYPLDDKEDYKDKDTFYKKHLSKKGFRKQCEDEIRQNAFKNVYVDLAKPEET